MARGLDRACTARLLAGSACLLITLFAGTSAKADESVSPLNIDWQPPAFQLTSSTGSTLQYPQDLDRPTIIFFWATWCPFCKALMPHLQSIQDQYGDSVRVLALNFGEDGDPAAYLADNGFLFDLFLTADMVAEDWGVKGTPGLFLARPDGQVVFSLRAIPAAALPDFNVQDEKRRRTQMAARMSPFWAAQLRLALDAIAKP
jgi:thiol-disulfide isomerase/thioredoxin